MLRLISSRPLLYSRCFLSSASSSFLSRNDMAKLQSLEKQAEGNIADKTVQHKLYDTMLQYQMQDLVVQRFEKNMKKHLLPPNVDLVLGDYFKALMMQRRSDFRIAMASKVKQKFENWGYFVKLLSNFIVILIVATAFSGIFQESGLMSAKDEPKTAITSDVRFSDVRGCDEAKEELEDVVKFLKNPEQFRKFGGVLPKGVLLTGPPGTGKTLLAKAVAGEADVPFFYASGSEFEEMFVGLGAKRIRELFKNAKATGRCIVFIDEIDAIGGTRKLKDMQSMRMTLNQLLVELDGFNTAEGTVFIAATNFSELLDPALTRPGRFDKQVVVGNPDVRGRKDILDLYIQKIKTTSDVDPMIIARGTPGCSGADLAHIVNSAAIEAATRGLPAVDMQLMEWAKDKVLMGAERKSAVLSDAVKKTTAYHEAGHAVTALFTEGSMPIHKATIIPRGRSLGMVMRLPEEDRYNQSLKELQADLDVALGGRVSEELFFGDKNITTGASSDFSQATRIARAMVVSYGMSEKVGPVQYTEKDIENRSPETKAVIDSEIERLIRESYDRVKKLVLEHKKDLETIAQALLVKESLTRDEILEILKD